MEVIKQKRRKKMPNVPSIPNFSNVPSNQKVNCPSIQVKTPIVGSVKLPETILLPEANLPGNVKLPETFKRYSLEDAHRDFLEEKPLTPSEIKILSEVNEAQKNLAEVLVNPESIKHEQLLKRFGHELTKYIEQENGGDYLPDRITDNVLDELKQDNAVYKRFVDIIITKNIHGYINDDSISIKLQNILRNNGCSIFTYLYKWVWTEPKINP